MKKDWSKLEPFRRRDHSVWSSSPGDHFGAFVIPHGKDRMVVIASDGDSEIPWEHVSLRIDNRKGHRLPTWDEMCMAKNYFWDPEECVMQLHPPKSDYVNNHPHVLHLWKPLKAEIPRPPKIAVGV